MTAAEKDKIQILMNTWIHNWKGQLGTMVQCHTRYRNNLLFQFI